MMVKNPAFTAVALTILALGIGANSALFSVVNSVLLKPLPYAEAGRLTQIGRELTMGRSNAVSISQFLFWRDNNRSYSAMATYDGRGGGTNLVEGDRPERIASIRISPGFFDVLGVSPQLGRGFLAEDGEEGAAKVAVISDGLWRRRFGADSSILGRTLRLSGTSYTVVGVMARGFDFTNHADIWTPLTLAFQPQDRSAVFYVVARLNDGVSLEAAQSDMISVGERLRGEYPDIMREGERVFVQPYLDQVASGSSFNPTSIRWSAASGRRFSSSPARSLSCSSSPAPTRPTSFSPAPPGAGGRSPCVPRSAPVASGSSDNC